MRQSVSVSSGDAEMRHRKNSASSTGRHGRWAEAAGIEAVPADRLLRGPSCHNNVVAGIDLYC